MECELCWCDVKWPHRSLKMVLVDINVYSLLFGKRLRRTSRAGCTMVLDSWCQLKHDSCKITHQDLRGTLKLVKQQSIIVLSILQIIALLFQLPNVPFTLQQPGLSRSQSSILSFVTLEANKSSLYILRLCLEIIFRHFTMLRSHFRESKMDLICVGILLLMQDISM
jgi:hypothetical protein